jgi:hypothetical protein
MRNSTLLLLLVLLVLEKVARGVQMLLQMQQQ